ncbi:MAG: hypothetical protein ACPF9D_14125, partial [Owenweeksia sp.]
ETLTLIVMKPILSLWSQRSFQIVVLLPLFLAFGFQAENYGNLSLEVPSNYYRVKSNQLKFMYTKEYGGDNESLDYFFVNDRLEVYNSGPTVLVDKGINYVSINISSAAVCPANDYYLLVVKNSKGEKQYMRFFKP